MARPVLKVVVYDENEIFRRGLKTCLREEPGIAVAETDLVFEAGASDVAVLSEQFIAEMPRDLRLVVCSDCSPTALVKQDRRVSAFLPRRTLRSEQLVAAVWATAVGLRVETPREARSDLDDRSISVLQMLALGHNTHEISLQLHYSERTIKSVISDLMLAMGARTRAQCVAEAVRCALI